MSADLRATIAAVMADGRQRSARCSVHPDDRASVSVGRAADGRVLVSCKAGCATPDVLKAAGMDWADLKAASAPESKPQIIATYAYHDETGALLYEAVRFEPKDFRFRRPNGTAGDWVWNLDGARRVLFGLPELRGQTAAFITEGEKDALALRAVGLAATTNAAGAGRWTDAYAEQLRAAGVDSVVVVPDNDEAGRKHADAVARSCVGAGLRVKVVALPNLPEHGDVSDWLSSGGTKAELLAIVESAPPYTVPSSSTSQTAAADRPVLTVLSAVTRESVDWIWPGRIARRKLLVVAGEPAEGKSTALTDIEARITRGARWPDGGAAPHGAILLLQAEDGLSDTIATRYDAAGADDRLVHVLSAVQTTTGSTRLLDLGRDLPHLEDAIRQVRPVLVRIDPLSAYLPKIDSWRDTDVRSVLAPLAALADKYDCAIAAVMHLTKNASAKVLHRVLGSVGFVAAARIVLAVATDPDDPERRLLLPVKTNIGAPAPVLAFRRDGHRIVWDADPVSGLTADGVFSAAVTDREDRRDAEQFLRDLLVGGEPVPAADVFRAARKIGISDTTLKRTKGRLKVRSRLVGFGANGAWQWYLPAAESAERPESSTRKLTLSDPLLVEQRTPESATSRVTLSLESLDNSKESAESFTTTNDNKEDTDAKPDEACPVCGSRLCEHDLVTCLRQHSPTFADLADVFRLSNVTVTTEPPPRRFAPRFAKH